MTEQNPTDQQKAILGATGRIVKINARAGTGKTTTLRMLAEKFRDRRTLYLVFNRRAKQSAQEVFPPNVRTYTLHALAYRGEGHKWTVSGGFAPADLLPAFRKDRQVLAGLTHGFLTFFLNSAYERLEDAVDPFTTFLSGDRLEHFRDRQEAIIGAARDLAGAWYHRKRDAPHDFYLKLFHKSGGFVRELDRYDQVLVDEGQDLSPIMLDALRRCRRRIVLVGDTHQQIYGFRFAVDAMERLEADEQFDLSLSFRFGKAIAGLATALIRQAKGRVGFLIDGNPEQPSSIRFFENIGKIPADAAVLSRTNLALFGNAMRLRAKGTAFQFERDLKPTLFRTLDVFWLQSGKKNEIRDPFIKSFKDYEGLKRYADQMEDFPLIGMYQIVEKHQQQFPSVIFEMSERCRKDGDEARKGVTLSTVHSAKGQQYREVYIHQDIADNLERAWAGKGSSEDINVAYVAVTRPTEGVYLCDGFKKILTPSWQQMMKRLHQRSIKRADSIELKPGRGTRPPGNLNRRLAIREPTRAKVNIGDRVRTPIGPGKVVEIREMECLIALDSGKAKLWRPISALR